MEVDLGRAMLAKAGINYVIGLVQNQDIPDTPLLSFHFTPPFSSSHLRSLLLRRSAP